MDPWPMIEADRLSLAEYLSGLSAEEWQRPSLCAGWNATQVAAHMLVIPTVSKRAILINFLGSGFNLKRFSDKMIDRITAAQSPQKMAETMRTTASSRSVPLGLKPEGVLTEVLVHAGDISEGVGRPLAFPTEHYVAGLEQMKGVDSALGCKTRINGLRLAATDADWAHGAGPVVQGTAQHLALAMAGRTAVMDHLSGDGVDTLRARS